MPPVKRKYSSPQRDEQAAATRDRIASSARRLFVAQGFAATTIEAIAREAGVSAPTVYAAYGSKRAILIALLDWIEREADLDGLHEDLRRNQGDPAAQIRLNSEFHVRFFERGGDIVGAVRAAADTDPQFGELLVEGLRRRREALRPLVRAWARAGALRDGVSEREADDIFWAMSGDELYGLLVTACGWKRERYAAWLTESLVRLLLKPAPATRSRGRRTADAGRA
jgi:AcrR family transcriptional regulator